MYMYIPIEGKAAQLHQFDYTFVLLQTSRDTQLPLTFLPPHSGPHQYNTNIVQQYMNKHIKVAATWQRKKAELKKTN